MSVEALKKLILMLCTLGLLWPLASVRADEAAVPWNNLSAEEQKLLRPLRERWGELSPQRQQRLRKGAARWSQMSTQ